MVRIQVIKNGEWADFAVVGADFADSYVRYARSRGNLEVRVVDVNA